MDPVGVCGSSPVGAALVAAFVWGWLVLWWMAVIRVRAARDAEAGAGPSSPAWRERVRAWIGAQRAVRLGAASAGAGLLLLVAGAGEAAAAVTLEDVRRAPRLQELGPAVPMIEDQALVDWATDWERRFEPLSPQSIDRLSVGRRSVWRTVAGVVLVAAAGYVAYESVRWHRQDAGRVVEGGGRSRSAWNHVGLAGGLSLAGITGGTGRMMLGPWSRVRVIEQGYL